MAEKRSAAAPVQDGTTAGKAAADGKGKSTDAPHAAPLAAVPAPPGKPRVTDLLRVRVSDQLAAVLPKELASMRRFATWRASVIEKDDGSHKLNKQPKSGRAYGGWGSSRQPGTWGTLSDALDVLKVAARHADEQVRVLRVPSPADAPAALHGLGLMLGNGHSAPREAAAGANAQEVALAAATVPDTNLWVIDLDRCRDPATGKATPEAQAFIDAAKSYSEVTPSGHGYRIIGRGGDVGGLHDFTGTWVEFYKGDAARFLTLTGECVAHPAVAAPMNERLADVLRGHSKKSRKAAVTSKVPMPPGERLPDSEWEELVLLATDGSEEQMALVREGLPAGDRSERVFGFITRLLRAGVEVADVFRWCITSPGIWDYALSKRHGDAARAQAFLWLEVQKSAASSEPVPVEGGAEEGEDAKKPTWKERLEKLNETYFIADEGGQVRVCRMKPDPEFDGREELVRYTFSAFAGLLQNEQAVVNDGKHFDKVYLGDEWLRWPKRRQYEGITFIPGGAAPRGCFNLWRGWAVEPVPGGDWSLLRDHIHHIICSGSDELYRYVVGWLKFLVQHPAVRPETALVLRGKEGAGKSIFGQMVRNLVGTHGFQVSNPKHLTGNFNAHLQNCLVLQADEAFFAGDRSHVSVLKSLVTDPELVVEPKGINAGLRRNRLHLILTSNDSWVVPAGLEARRFCVLDVSDRHLRDRKYFAPLSAAVKDEKVLGGMLHHLQTEPLGDFEVRDVPMTKGLDDQKRRSLDSVPAWLLDVLTVGQVGREVEWVEFVPTQTLWDAYAEWMKKTKPYDRILPTNIFAQGLTDLGVPWLRRCPANLSGERNKAGYLLGTLDVARGRFCAKTGLADAFNQREDLSDVL